MFDRAKYPLRTEQPHDLPGERKPPVDRNVMVDADESDEIEAFRFVWQDINELLVPHIEIGTELEHPRRRVASRCAPEDESARAVDVAEHLLMSPSEPRGARWRHTVFIAYVVVMVGVFLLPVPSTPLEESRHVDKVVHFGIFLGFALLFYIDRASRTRWILLASFAFAAAIEVVQWVVPYREGEWWDFVAGAAGACVGAVLLLLIERRRLPPSRPTS